MGIEPYGANETTRAEEARAANAGLSLRQVLKVRQFYLMMVVLFGFVATMQVMMAHLAPHAVDLGMTAAVAASFVSVFAATSLIGRNLAGLLSDRIGAAWTITIHLTATVGAMVWLLAANDTASFYGFAAFYGLAYGGVVPMQTLMAGELFGLRSLGIITAALMLGGSLGGALGPPLAGAIFDSSGSYQWAFRVCLMLLVLAIISSMALRRRRAASGLPA
jgi:MFS family permease